MKKVSSKVGWAFSYINDKKIIIQNILEKYNERSLMKVIDIEKNLNILELNGVNNKKLTNDKDLHNYVSLARTFKFLIRVFNFKIKLF